MTEIEALDLINSGKATLIDKSNSLHIYEEQYEINNYLVKLLWAIGGSDEPEIEIIDIKTQLLEDLKYINIGMAFLTKLPTEIIKNRQKYLSNEN